MRCFVYSVLLVALTACATTQTQAAIPHFTLSYRNYPCYVEGKDPRFCMAVDNLYLLHYGKEAETAEVTEWIRAQGYEPVGRDTLVYFSEIMRNLPDMAYMVATLRTTTEYPNPFFIDADSGELLDDLLSGQTTRGNKWPASTRFLTRKAQQGCAQQFATGEEVIACE